MASSTENSLRTCLQQTFSISSSLPCPFALIHLCLRHATKECSAATQIRSQDVSIPHFRSLPNESTYLLSTEMHQQCVFFFSCQGSFTGEPVETLRPVLLQGRLSDAHQSPGMSPFGKITFCFVLFDGTILLMPWTKAGFIRTFT